MALTTEDKQWFVEQLQGVRTEFSEQLKAVRTEFSEQLERLETRLLAELHRRDEANRQWKLEQLESLETKLLTAFHSWASPFETRQRSHSAALRALEVELEELTDRVIEPRRAKRSKLPKELQ